MAQAAESQGDILSALKKAAGGEQSKENLFGMVFDLFQAAKNRATEQELEMCEDVLTQLVGYVEIEARGRIADRIASLESAPKRVIQCLAVEPIQVSQPVLCKSPLLDDEDLLTVARLCGPHHLEAIAERKVVSMPVTNELMRLGTVQVWERLAQNNGAKLADKSIAFLTNRARENKKIQLGLIERPDLPEAVLTRLISEAGESIRAHLERNGRDDLLAHLDAAQAVAKKRVLSTSSILGFEYDAAYQQVLRHDKVCPLKNRDLLEAAKRNDFPRTCAIFSIIAGLDLEDAVHWLSRREIDPAIVAFKALGFDEELVSALLKTGPWKNALTDGARQRALKALSDLKPDVAKRIFLARSGGFTLQHGIA